MSANSEIQATGKERNYINKRKAFPLSQIKSYSDANSKQCITFLSVAVIDVMTPLSILINTHHLCPLIGTLFGFLSESELPQ